MDEPFHEETYEDLITPSFFSLERDTLHMVEVTQAVITWIKLNNSCDVKLKTLLGLVLNLLIFCF